MRKITALASSATDASLWRGVIVSSLSALVILMAEPIAAKQPDTSRARAECLGARQGAEVAINGLRSLIGAGTANGMGFYICPSCGAREGGIKNLRTHAADFQRVVSYGWALASLDPGQRPTIAKGTFCCCSMGDAKRGWYGIGSDGSAWIFARPTSGSVNPTTGNA